MFARRAVTTFLLAVGTASVVFADADQAKKYVEEAKHELELKSWEDAKSKLELAEAELDGVDAAAKAQITASIDAVKKGIAAGTLEGNKQKYGRKLEAAMREAEGSIGNLVTWNGAAASVKEVFDNADAQAAIPDEIAAAKKKFATFEKINGKKFAAAMKEQLDASVAELEKSWAENKPKITANDDKDSAITQVDRDLESTRRELKKLPADSEEGKAYAARVDKISKEFTELALADKVKEKAEQLQRAWDSYKEDWAGWEAEKVGPTFDAYSKESSEKMSALLAPKTREFIGRANQWLDNRKDDEDYQKLQAAPAIKAINDKIVADRAAALTKMEGFADSFLKEAEKLTLNQDKVDTISKFQDSLKNNIAGSEKLAAYEKRAQVLIDKFAGKNAAADEAKVAFYKESTDKATAAWPGMKGKFTTVDGFDPGNAGATKGKLIRIETDNLMGYRFKPGDFPFATTVNGVPVAAKYDPAVAAAIKAVEEKLGRSLGDDDNDGKWEIIAEVTGQTGKLTKRVNVEGKIKDDAGNTATVTGERAETVDAPIITIVAAHCGPLAASK